MYAVLIAPVIKTVWERKVAIPHFAGAPSTVFMRDLKLDSVVGFHREMDADNRLVNTFLRIVMPQNLLTRQ